MSEKEYRNARCEAFKVKHPEAEEEIESMAKEAHLLYVETKAQVRKVFLGPMVCPECKKWVRILYVIWERAQHRPEYLGDARQFILRRELMPHVRGRRNRLKEVIDALLDRRLIREIYLAGEPAYGLATLPTLQTDPEELR